MQPTNYQQEAANVVHPLSNTAADYTVGGLFGWCSTACTQQGVSGQLAAADKIREESCQFQKLPHHHQTSWAATWLWGPAPPPERAKQVLPWCGPQCQDWSRLGHLGQPAACPCGCWCICAGWLLFSCRDSLVVSLRWALMAWTPQAGPRPLSLGVSLSACSFTFEVLLCLFYPLANHVTVICSSLGQKLFFSTFFAQLLLQQDCNLNQYSSKVINKLSTKGNCILGGCNIPCSGLPVCFPRARGHVDWTPKWLAQTFKH